MKYEQYAFTKDCYETSVAEVWIKSPYHPDPRICIEEFIKCVSNPILNTLAPKSEMPGICFGSFKEAPVWPAYNVKDLSSYIETTQLLLLDVDECPVTLDKVQEYLDRQLGCWNLWYTTPRSTREHPRFRLMLATSRPITMDEKRALCAPLTQKLEGLDKASFEPSKFCLLPCICFDSIEPNNYKCGGSKCDLKLDVDKLNLVIEHPEPAIRIAVSASKFAERFLDYLIPKINNAPDGHSQPVIKSGLANLMHQDAVPLDYIESRADEIDRDDRRRDFIGIATWMCERYR